VGDLKVVPSDLNDRANSQRRVAGIIEGAEQAIDGSTITVARTHGLVCAATIAALGEAQMSRSAATKAMSGLSNQLAENLDNAASDYNNTDQSEEGNINGQMRPPR
jgi:hypothetical protein